MPDNITQPAIDELYKAYDLLYDEIAKKTGANTYRDFNNKAGRYEQKPVPVAEKPVIRIENAGKRTAKSWYKSGVWETDIANTLATLTGDKAIKRDEIVFASSIFNDSTESIVTELIKQMIHVASVRHQQYEQYAEVSIKTNANTGVDYVTKAYTYQASRLGFEQTGKRNQDIALSENRHSGRAEEIRTLIDTTVKGLDEEAFKINSTQNRHVNSQIATMKKWQCACTNIRTTAYIEMDCKLCGEKVEYADKDKDEQATIDHLANEEKRFKSGPYAVGEMANRRRVLRYLP